MQATAIGWTERTWNPDEWRLIPSFPNYEVTREGEIRNRRTGRLLRLMATAAGHLYFLPARGCKCYVHRAVLEAFVGLRPIGMECRHLDGNPANNRLTNLTWGTRLENVADKQRHGTQPRGEQSPAHKLTERQVIELRQRHGSTSLRVLAREYGVSHTAIRRAATGRKWAHVGGAGV